jgi:hypothetical protein
MSKGNLSNEGANDDDDDDNHGNVGHNADDGTNNSDAATNVNDGKYDDHIKSVLTALTWMSTTTMMMIMITMTFN